MAFVYDTKTGAVIDHQTGITIRHGGGKPDFNCSPFTFIDPRSNAIPIASFKETPGEFVFYAEPIRHTDRSLLPDGSYNVRHRYLGYEVATKPLGLLFGNYTGGDPARLAEVCAQIAEGLKAYLRRDGSGDEPHIKFV